MKEPNLEQELERLLNATRAGTEPDADARGRVRAALALGLAGAGPVKVGPTTRVGLGAKLWLLSTLLGALLVGVAWLARAEKSSPTAALARASASSAAALAAPQPAVDLAPPVVVASGGAAAIHPPAATDAARPASPPPRGAAKAEEPADELALVSSMQLALRSGNASLALALANEHARRFPGGALAQEREGARAIAHCQLAAEPATRAAIQSAFEARYAGSPYVARVRDACVR